MSIINNIIEKYGVDKLNTLTKYPSIMTYHALGEKGSLVEKLVDDINFSAVEDCYITEKIDGTNARIIFSHDDYVIGSREELLYARGDRFGNPQLNIVNTVKDIAERIIGKNEEPYSDKLWVVFGEVYGGNVTAASKKYTSDKTYGYRLFDVATIALTILEEPIDKISSWREHGGQRFSTVDGIKGFASLAGVEHVPYISAVKSSELPVDRMGMFQFLGKFADTQAGINSQGKAEGIVVRTFNRSIIRKIRFEDYERTAKRENWTQRI